MDLISVALEFVLAVLVAFAGFMLRSVAKRQDAIGDGFHALAKSVAAFAQQIGDLAERISRLERVQDEDNRDRKQT